MKTTREGAIVAREGYPFIAIGVALTVASGLVCWFWLAAVWLILTGWVVWFFRNPERAIPQGEGLVVAPADGRVIGVLATDGSGLSQAGGMRVNIFMNVFNVHVNRMPVDGMVTDIEYVKGRFVNASFDKASEHNERTIYTLRTPQGQQVRMVQIAGLVARRIVWWSRPGDAVRRGEIFGLIRFGSRVDIYLPPGATVAVREGQKVAAGATVIGKLP